MRRSTRKYDVQFPHKYDRVERERRFILDRFPIEVNTVRTRHITDRYINHTRLRLRHQLDDDGSGVFKLTQKIPLPGDGAQQGFITNMYLTAEEFRTLAHLPAKQLKKTRYSVPPFGIDVFEDSLAGLVLAEAEFDSASDADALLLPSFLVHEVSADPRFTGGSLAHASRQEIQAWLLEYGIQFGSEV